MPGKVNQVDKKMDSKEDHEEWMNGKQIKATDRKWICSPDVRSKKVVTDIIYLPETFILDIILPI